MSRTKDTAERPSGEYAARSSRIGELVRERVLRGGEMMAAEMLGIMVTKYENLAHIIGTVTAARAAGRPVSIFLTDEGVRFTTDAAFLDLLKTEGTEFSCCDHSCERVGITEKVEGISYGTQYNNAAMLHDSARVLVF